MFAPVGFSKIRKLTGHGEDVPRNCNAIIACLSLCFSLSKTLRRSDVVAPVLLLNNLPQCVYLVGSGRLEIGPNLKDASSIIPAGVLMGRLLCSSYETYLCYKYHLFLAVFPSSSHILLSRAPKLMGDVHMTVPPGS
jgi:hypothetical protein